MPEELAVQRSSDSSSLMQLIERVAVDPTVDPAKLRELLAVKREWEADEARKAYAVAFTAFKRQMPRIVKYKEIRDKQGNVRSRWAPLDYICEKCIPIMLELGLTHRWVSEAIEGKTQVTCYIRHENGHEERGATMAAPPDKSDFRTELQCVGSTLSYLERYTLVASLGLPIFDDTDGTRPSAGKMDQRALMDWMAAIEACDSVPALNAEWKKAAEGAKKSGDNEALNALTAAAGKRKNQILRKADGR